MTENAQGGDFWDFGAFGSHFGDQRINSSVDFVTRDQRIDLLILLATVTPDRPDPRPNFT